MTAGTSAAMSGNVGGDAERPAGAMKRQIEKFFAAQGWIAKPR